MAAEAQTEVLGLSDAEAADRLRRLGPPAEKTSRSVRSIVLANVLTLFNAIILVFFILILSQGLWADALFGVIAIVNSAIGIRQEVKAKETLDNLALLVAPRAEVIREGRGIELRADEIVPGDVIRVEPGDQLVADGEVVDSRGLTLDESLLTGESDGIAKHRGDRLLSGSFATSGSGHYEVDAVREDSYAERIAGQAKEFRHPPSPLQVEVDRILWATAILLVPMAILMLGGFIVRGVDFTEAAQTATAGLITLIPEGLVLLMSVTLAVAAVRLARMDTLVQQISATEALAAVDTVCVDKTGTLTDGTLELVEVVSSDPDGPAAAERELGLFAASAGERNRTLETIAEAFPERPAGVTAEVPFSSRWKWSGLTLNGEGRARSYVVGAPDVLVGSGAMTLPGPLQRRLELEAGRGRRVVAFGEAVGTLPSDPGAEPPPRLEPRALVVLEETMRADAADTVDFLREQEVDLKLISGDARETVTAVAGALGIDREAGVIDGSALPDDPAGLAAAAERNTIFCRITPDQKKALVGALSEAGRFTAMIGDGVNDVPALKQARLAVAMGSGSQITKGIADIVLLRDQFSMLPRAVAEGRRIARNIHRLGRLYLTKTVYAGFLIVAAALVGFTFPFLPRQLTVAALLTIGIPSFVLALAPSEGPLYRGRLLRALAAFAVPAGVGIGIGSLVSYGLVDGIFGGTLNEGRTAATTTLIVLGLAFILLLERGPGREHIAIQGYMLAMVTALGGLYAAILAAEPLRSFFELDLLSAGQWFVCMLSVATGLVVASALWRLPYVQRLELDPAEQPTEAPLMADHRRTKIVATIGPSSRSPKIVERLISAGADVFRLNFSHGDEASHAENVTRIRAASELMGKWVAILGDLPGPKLRLDEVENGFAQIETGRELILTSDATIGSAELLSVGWDGLTGAVGEGDPIYLADGRVRLRALEVETDGIRCMVEAGGRVASHQGVNLPSSGSGMPAAGAADLGWIDFAVDQEIDLLAVSFVRSAADLEPIAERLAERHSDIPLIAKIEKPQAAEQAEAIVGAATSGIMVARGDLGIELPIEAVPATQKRLIRLAGSRSKPVITATQMLASMVTSDRPTRAEVTDVANAIYDGTDAVMLSEETAIGDHPVEAVAVMDRVARETEQDLPYTDWLTHRVEVSGGDDVSTSVAQGAVASTYRLGLAAIVVPTSSGRTARIVSSLRPEVPILAISPREETVRRLNLLFGVRCVLHEDWGDLRDLLADCAMTARREGVAKPGELIAVTAGLPDQELGTNLFEIHRVPW